MLNTVETKIHNNNVLYSGILHTTGKNGVSNIPICKGKIASPKFLRPSAVPSDYVEVNS